MKSPILAGFLLVSALPLAGCTVTASQERAAAERADTSTCTSYGYKPGTPDFARCRQSKDEQRQAETRMAIGQIDRNNREATDYMERSLARPAVNCTGTTYGNTTSTTCR